MFRESLPALLTVVLLIPASMSAQHPPAYDAFQAGADAARRYDAKQRQALNLQVKTIEQMKWYSGFGAAGFGTVYHRDPPSLDYVYGTGRWTVTDRYFSATPRVTPNIFQPWPYVPGDIWGYRWNSSVRQPIGRREIQTGPNRWESHPIYADELTPPAAVEVPVAPTKPIRPPGPRQF